MLHVIFICTGNICRSAMAAGYLKYRLKELGMDDGVLVSSAGTHAVQGETSPINAKLAIAKYGVNIEEHFATTLENSKINTADYILVMTERHKRDVISKFPELEEKIKLLGGYAKNKKYEEIDDPWGYNYNVYERCAQEIVASIEEFIKHEL